jgi:isopentenyl diphosphate isomerase/L-lactate dehydrogenase-like FMN-dependent dehydrogenase
MSSSSARCASRRQFLQWLSGSPLLGLPGLAAWAAETPSKFPDPIIWAPFNPNELITSPKDAINVFDFEPVARKNVPPAHFGYMASGIDDEVTLRANREGFLKFQLRPRRLNDVSKVDMSVEIFGSKLDTPIIIAPTGGNRFFHTDGEIAVAKAARAGNHVYTLSTSGTASVEAVTEARGAPVWYQLYASPKWEIAQALVRRAEAAGCPVLEVTVDRLGGRNQETLFRLQRTDPRDCKTCHQPGAAARAKRRPMYDGIDLSDMTNMESSNMTWDFIKRLRDITRMKIVIKGILAHEDARLCVETGVDGLIVSNHGGRGEDSGRSTIDALPEIVDAVGGRIPVLVDGGFRRGTDIVKALAIGARAVCVGRPYLWGLGAFGQPGVERVLELLRLELRAAMQQTGVKNVKELNPAFVRRAT